MRLSKQLDRLACSNLKIMEKKSSSSSHTNDEKERISDIEHANPILTKDGGHIGKELDISLALPGMLGIHEEDKVDPIEAGRVKRKLDRRILPLLMLVYTLQYLDKSTIGATSILGFLQDNHLTVEQFNNLGTFFYLGYLVSQIPHSYAFQKLPVAKYLAFQIFVWAVLVGATAACRSYQALVVVRFLLGLSEGCVTPGIMLINSMFYTRTEMGERVGWTFQCNGFAAIISGLIAFGVYHAEASRPAVPATATTPEIPAYHPKVAQWQWFMIVIAALTLLTFILFGIFFPDSPTSAKFITEEEKVIVVKRIKANQSGIETKAWKKHQFLEALKDPKAYLFMLYAILANFVGGVGIQYSLIIKDFGFNVMQTTLLNIPSGACMIITITFSMWLLHKFPNARAWISIGSYFPSIVSSILMIALPNTKIGLLIAFYCFQLGTAPAVVLSLSWITTTTSGHTKKLTMHAVWLIGYCVGLMVAPQWWKDKYKPRNRVPWAIILVSFFFQVAIILLLRWYLNRENRLRDATAASATTEEERERYSEYGWLEVPDSKTGMMTRVRVEKRFLDMTDFENLNFRYVL
ncbi:MFS general substrate transporter [Serendipita vermifera]|nr:MFS general substrate transporter [Serendipita vermifera]